MCQQGLLNVYALADPLAEQDSKHFMTTIQVGGGGVQAHGVPWGAMLRRTSSGRQQPLFCGAAWPLWHQRPRVLASHLTHPPAASPRPPLLPQLPLKRRIGVDPYARE